MLNKNKAMDNKINILRKIKKNNFSNLTIAIKSPNPTNDRKWGDYSFALSLKKAFEKKKFNVVIHEYENWYDNDDEEDIVIVLRGLHKYKPHYKKINLMWNISHPDKISKEEYESYDAVFIASEKYAKNMDKKLDTTVQSLIQCTDDELFYQKIEEKYKTDILFVGNTRGTYQKIIKDVLNTSNDISIYGQGWDEFIDENHIKGKYIENKILNQHYSSCKILLNDHWEDMKEKEFPSNRLFDALACGTLIISDKFPSIESIFEDSVITYEDIDDLDEKIKYYLNNENKRKEIGKKGQKIVLNNHTFNNRVDEIIESLKSLDINSKILDKQNSIFTAYDQPMIKSMLLNYITGRIDIKNFGNKDNSIEIISNKNPKMYSGYPDWFKDSQGLGMTIISNTGSIDIKLKCINNGNLTMFLRSPDIRDKKLNRFPIFIDYTSLKINGKEELTENQLVSHDEPYEITREVKDNELITLNVKWKPFNSESIYKNQKEKENKKLNQIINQKEKENKKLNQIINQKEKENKKLKKELDEIHNSTLWKIKTRL